MTVCGQRNSLLSECRKPILSSSGGQKGVPPTTVTGPVNRLGEGPACQGGHIRAQQDHSELLDARPPAFFLQLFFTMGLIGDLLEADLNLA